MGPQLGRGEVGGPGEGEIKGGAKGRHWSMYSAGWNGDFDDDDDGDAVDDDDDDVGDVG